VGGSHELGQALRDLRQAVERVEEAASQEPASDLSGLADQAFQDRRARDSHFPAGLFVDAEWDLLLVLARACGEGGEVRQTEAFRAVGVPHTTGLRVIQRLEAAGLAERSGHPGMKRSLVLRLTAEGARRMSLALDAKGSKE
jgi:DNA-binding MarR family transcriptional regulator